MQLELTLQVDDEDLIEDLHDTGLTRDGYVTLVRVLSDAGFSIVEGPNGVNP